MPVDYQVSSVYPLLGEADTPPCGNADKTCQPDTLIILTFYYSLDNFRNRQRSPLRTLCRSIDCQSVHPPHRLGNKHGRASAIFGYFPLSFPHTLTQRKRDCVSKKAQTQRRPRMCIDRAPAGVKAPGERKVYPKRHFIAVPVSPCVETNNSDRNPKNCPNYSDILEQNSNLFSDLPFGLINEGGLSSRGPHSLLGRGPKGLGFQSVNKIIL